MRQILKYYHPSMDNSFLHTSEFVIRYLMNYCRMSYDVRLRSSLDVNKNVPSSLSYSLLPSIRKTVLKTVSDESVLMMSTTFVNMC